MKESIDIYYHIDAEDFRKSYMAYVTQLCLAHKYDGYRRKDTW